MKSIYQKIAIAALSMCAMSVQAQTKMTLGHNAAVGNPKHEASVKFSEIVKAKTNGRIDIQVAPAANWAMTCPS